MFRYDRVLVAPAKNELNQALTEATLAANQGARARMLCWKLANTTALIRASFRATEGFQQWNAEGERKSRGFGKDTRTALAVAWWTDPLDRQHYRIVADRILCASSHIQNMISPYAKRPALWLVYPEHVLSVATEKSPLKVYCHCGACGPPEATLWMGSCCGPCHDRANEGRSISMAPGMPRSLLLNGHSGWVAGAVFAPDGCKLVSHGAEIIVWDLHAGEKRFPGFESTTSISSLSISPDGDTVASHVGRDQVALWSLSGGQLIRTLSFSPTSYFGDILDLEFNHDGSILAVMPHGRVELWDVASGQLLELHNQQLAHHAPKRLLAFSPDENTLFIAAHRYVIKWDVVANQSQTIEFPGVPNPDVIDVSPDGRILGFVDDSTSGCAYLWDLQRSMVRAKLSAPSPRDLVFSPDGKLLAIACGNGNLQLHSASNGKALGVFSWHTSHAVAVAFSSDSQWLATASADGCAKIWPVRVMLER